MDATDFIKYKRTGVIKDIVLKDLYKVYFNDTYLLDDETPLDMAEGMTWL